MSNDHILQPEFNIECGRQYTRECGRQYVCTHYFILAQWTVVIRVVVRAVVRVVVRAVVGVVVRAVVRVWVRVSNHYMYCQLVH